MVPRLTMDAEDDKKKQYDKEAAKASNAMIAVLETLDLEKD